MATREMRRQPDAPALTRHTAHGRSCLEQLGVEAVSSVYNAVPEQRLWRAISIEQGWYLIWVCKAHSQLYLGASRF